MAGYDKRMRAEALKAAEAAAKEHGFNISDLLGGRPAKSAVPAKYRNPDSPYQTWSGRGRRPFWFVTLVEGGTAPEDLEI